MTQTTTETLAQQSPRAAALSPADIERLKGQFAEDGYVVVRDVVSKGALKDLCTRVLGEFEKALSSGTLFSGGGLNAGHLNCCPGEASRAIYDELQQRGFIDLVRAILPKSVRLPNVGCNLNLPNSIVQHYHTDRPFTNDFMILNVAVVDTEVENGAIDVVPGTHQKFYKFWRFALERASSRPGKRLPLRQGDVVLRTSNLWHRGMPNRTTVPRPMLAFTWEDGGTVHEDPFRLSGGKVTFHPNWYYPTLMGRLRERAFIVAPITYEAYRFVRSLFSNKGYDT